MVKRWHAENCIHLAVAGGILLALLIGWILYLLFGHSMIRAAYEGGLGAGWIRGRGARPLEVYLSFGTQIALEISLLVLGGVFFSFLIPKRKGAVNNLQWNVLAVSLIMLSLVMATAWQWLDLDFRVYCSAVTIWQEGENPYLAANTVRYAGGELPFFYPPFSLYLLTGLCYGNALLGLRANYALQFLIFLTLIFLLLRKEAGPFRPGLLMTLLLTILASPNWVLYTGNIIWIDLFLLAVTLFWIGRERYGMASIFLACSGLLRIVPLFFGLLFVLTPQSRGRRWRNLMAMISVFAGFHVLSLLLLPQLTLSYYASIFGRVPGQLWPVLEGGGIITPSLFFLIQDLSAGLGPGNEWLALFLYGLLVVFVLGIYGRLIRGRNRNFLEIFSVGMLVVMILLPRMKIYYYIWASLPIYFLVRSWNRKDTQWAVLIVSGLPLILYGFFWAMVRGSYLGRFLKSGDLLIEYGQGIALFLFFLFFMARDAGESRTAGSEKQRKEASGGGEAGTEENR